MDIQLKRGLIEPCVLAVLNMGDSYGYKIIRDISECMDVSESTLYPVLKRLEGLGMVEVYSVEHNSRLRKYYKITDVGRQSVRDFVKGRAEMLQVFDYVINRMGGLTDE